VAASFSSGGMHIITLHTLSVGNTQQDLTFGQHTHINAKDIGNMKAKYFAYVYACGLEYVVRPGR
jgi:hypothetical protein